MARRPAQTACGQPSTPSFTQLSDLASETVGGRILFATDDWFATAENLLRVSEPVFKPLDFTDFGKWMDGWETRRKRIPGHDWCIIQLGAAGVIHGLEVNTAYFTGNYAPRVSVQAACLDTEYCQRESNSDRMGTAATQQEFREISKLNSQKWDELLPMTTLGAGYEDTCLNFFPVGNRNRWTHIRLNIFPDGGVARLRVYGIVKPDWTQVPSDQLVDLVAMLNGGLCVAYSDAHYGHARNIINPGRARVMAEGWETARRLDRPAILEADNNGILQVPGNEWAEFKLGHVGVVTKILVDTNHFKGNFPDSCTIEGCLNKEVQSERATETWRVLLQAQKLSAHKEHEYSKDDLCDLGPISHIRVTMAPDGGISRLRLWGYRSI